MLRGSDSCIRFGVRPALAAAVILAGGLAGCAAAPPDFNSPEPAARNAAIVRAAREKDSKAVPDLIRMLESDDPTTRVLAIRALERITGQTHGYHPEADEGSRTRAVEAWTAWIQKNRSTGV